MASTPGQREYIPPPKADFIPLTLDNLPERLGFTENEQLNLVREKITKATKSRPDDIEVMDHLEVEYKRVALKILSFQPPMIRHSAEVGSIIELGKIWRDAGQKERYLGSLLVAGWAVGDSRYNVVGRVLKDSWQEAAAKD